MKYRLTYYQEFNKKGELKGHQVVISAKEVKSMWDTLEQDKDNGIETRGFEYGLKKIKESD